MKTLIEAGANVNQANKVQYMYAHTQGKTYAYNELFIMRRNDN